jgi:hypothetical protein
LTETKDEKVQTIVGIEAPPGEFDSFSNSVHLLNLTLKLFLIL